MLTTLFRTVFSQIFLVFLCLWMTVVSAMADSTLNKIQQLIEQQNIEKAFEEIKGLQKGKSKLLPEIQLAFGDLYLALEQPAKARDYFEKTLFSSTEFDDRANAGMAEANFRLGNIAEAETLADKALKYNPDLIRAKLVKGAIWAERSSLNRAREFYKSAMDASRKSTLAGRKFAEMLIRNNLYREAEEVLKDTLIKNADDAPTLEVYGSLKFLQSKYEEAIDYRILAEEKYRSAGNTIKANEMLAWLNIRGKPELKPIEKPAVEDKVPESKKPTPVAQPVINAPAPALDTTSKGKPPRKAFPPLPKPEPIRYDDKKGVTTGSGVILNDGYWVLTNKHVAEDLDYIVVRNGLGETRLVKEVILAKKDDLALLILEKPYNEDYSLSVEDFKTVSPGENVYVMGYPMSSIFGTFHPTITTGLVSNPRGFGGKAGEFQTTAKVNPGNSGGPIFNKHGQIVGLATGGVDVEKVRKEDGIIISDLAYGVDAQRALNFLNQPIPVSLKQRYEYSADELYKYMRSGVVLIVGQ